MGTHRQERLWVEHHERNYFRSRHFKSPRELAIAELTVKVKTTGVILNYQKKRIIIITT